MESGGFYGLVAADEPRAVFVARDVLADGGTAADAATALYFTLAVTLPSAASIGGGGACVVHDHETNNTETVDFLAGTPKDAAGVQQVGVPGNLRGIFALHARYGQLRWEGLLVEAENLARFGHPMSRALARDLASVAPMILADPESRRIFARSDGRLAEEGDDILQIDLGAFLTRVRLRGPGEFYAGPLSRNFQRAVADAGGSMDAADMRGELPVWSAGPKVRLDEHVLHFASTSTGAGAVAAPMLATLLDKDRYEAASADERPRLLAQTVERALEAAGHGSDAADGLDAKPSAPAARPGETSFVVVDRFGSAVSCTLTMNGLFGLGRIAPGTGVMLARAPRSRPLGVTPLLLVNHNTNNVLLAVSATGGAAAAPAVAEVALKTMIDGMPLSDAVDAPRLTTRAAAADGGADPAEAPAARVNAILCRDGAPRRPETCRAHSDPRGFGLALAGQ